MPFSIAAFFSILPEFAIAGILSMFFYYLMKNIRNVKLPRPKSQIFQSSSNAEATANRAERETAHSNGERAISDSEKDTLQPSIMPEVQLMILSVDIWILLAMAIFPRSALMGMLPALSRAESYLLYGSLIVIFAVALLTTVISRMGDSKRRLAIAIILSAILTYVSFRLPGMAWLYSFRAIFQVVIIYCSIAFVIFLTYWLGVFLKQKQVFKISAYSSIGAYAITILMLLVNVFQTAR